MRHTARDFRSKLSHAILTIFKVIFQQHFSFKISRYSFYIFTNQQIFDTSHSTTSAYIISRKTTLSASGFWQFFTTRVSLIFSSRSNKRVTTIHQSVQKDRPYSHNKYVAKGFKSLLDNTPTCSKRSTTLHSERVTNSFKSLLDNTQRFSQFHKCNFLQLLGTRPYPFSFNFHAIYCTFRSTTINFKVPIFLAIYCDFRYSTTSISNKQFQLLTQFTAIFGARPSILNKQFQFLTQFTANLLDHTMNKNPIRYHGGLARATKFDLYSTKGYTMDTPNVHQTIFSINSFFNKIVYSDF